MKAAALRSLLIFVSCFATGTVLAGDAATGQAAQGKGVYVFMRDENFDGEPANWEGINNRGIHFEPKVVVQNFGYSRTSQRAGVKPGEIGGIINPAAEPAYYGYRLPKPLT